MNAIAVSDLTLRYRGHEALRGVTLRFAENTIHGLLGRNGAGKTSLMRVVAGHEFETGGTVRVFGAHPRENAAVLDQVCFVRESLRYPDMYKLKNVFQAASLSFPNWDADYADRLAGEFAIPRNRRVQKFSRGQHSAVGVVLGLAARAPLTLFDEPYLGLDAVARQLFYDRLLEDFAEHPRTIVLSTHLIDEVADLIEHVTVLDRGRVLLDADAEDLRGRAVSVSGPADAVERYVAGTAVLHRQKLGGTVRVAVAEWPAGPTPAGVATTALSLQELVVLTTQASNAADPGAGSDPGSDPGSGPATTTALTTSSTEGDR